MTEEIFDFSEFASDERQSFYDLVDLSQSFPQWVVELFDTFIALPIESQKLICCAYAIAPSPLCTRLPILVLNGKSGTGKSTLGKLANAIHFGKNWEKASVSPNETLAALRNLIQERKFYEGTSIEKLSLLVWDDIDTNVLLLNDAIFRLLKIGYDRATDTIRIASQKSGENLVFRCFCPKVVSSVTRFWQHPKLQELERRVLPIHCAKMENVSLESIEDYDWEGINNELHKFWSTPLLCKDFKSLQLALKRKNSKYRKQFIGNNLQWAISHDLITTMTIAGIVPTVSDAIQTFNEYWEWHEKNMDNESAFHALLKEFCNNQAEQQIKDKEALMICGLRDDADALEITLEPSLLWSTVQSWQRDGRLETRISPELLSEQMALLGWQLTGREWKYTH